MNLQSHELHELNGLLNKEKLVLPSFRREVSPSGSNYAWLQKNILKKNPTISPRLKQLLYIK